MKNLLLQTKKGDTIIEVMISLAIFAAVAIISINLMNSGIYTGERSIELTTARNELNAQAEAIRFIHSSYIAELNLATCGPWATSDTICQHYANLWTSITNNAIFPDDFSIELPPETCQDLYQAPAGGSASAIPLVKNKAFIVNPRRLGIDPNNNLGLTLINAASGGSLNSRFQAPPLSARLVYTTVGIAQFDDTLHFDTSNALEVVEGIWDIIVRGPNGTGGRPVYYDVYIQACWQAANTNTPSVLDTVIRLYNPSGS